MSEERRAYIKARIHADEAAKGRVDVLCEGTRGVWSHSFKGYDEYIESGIAFSDDSDSDDSGTDDIVASALKSVMKTKSKNEKMRKAKKEKKKKHEKPEVGEERRSPQEELVERAKLLAYLKEKLSGMLRSKSSYFTSDQVHSRAKGYYCRERNP